MGTTPRNEGEGNKTADRNYREATQKFVESERGREAIENAGDVSASEEREIERAEDEAKRHAKGHDPEEIATPDDTDPDEITRDVRPNRDRNPDKPGRPA
jgi:hypothetical protein